MDVQHTFTRIHAKCLHRMLLTKSLSAARESYQKLHRLVTNVRSASCGTEASNLMSYFEDEICGLLGYYAASCGNC
jgi:hypothetical protein